MLEFNAKVRKHKLEIDARMEQHEAYNQDGTVYEEGLLWQEHPWLKDKPALEMEPAYADFLLNHFQHLDSTRDRDQGVPLFISIFDIRRYATEILELENESREFEIFVQAMRQIDEWMVSSAVEEMNSKSKPAQEQNVGGGSGSTLNKRDVIG